MSTRFLFKISFRLFCTLISLPAFGQTHYFPDSIWQHKKPAEVKMNAAMIDSAVQFAIRHESKTDYDLQIANRKAFSNEPNFRILGPMKHRGKPAGMIIKNGYIIAQWGDLDRVDMTFSVTKSYLSTIAGLAIDQGLIRHVEEPVIRYVRDEQFEGEHNSKITWKQLLNQSSDWSGCLFDICDWADRPPKEGSIDDWKTRKRHTPGEVYKYNDVRVNALAYALLQVWRRPLPVVLKEKIMDPIGASSTWRWYGYENSFVNVDGLMMQSVSGGGHFGGGLFINTLDQARYGLLFLRKGKWKDKQLISEKWVNEARQPSKANKSYGYLWWNNYEKALGNVSENIFYASGFGGNFVVVDQENELLIVVRWLEPSKIGELVQLVSGAIEKK